MVHDLNSEDFTNSIKSRIEQFIFNYFECENKEELSSLITNFKPLYLSIYNDKYINIDNKKNFYLHFENKLKNYIKNWLVDFLSNGISKICEKKINIDLLVNSEYFIFRFLANKEKIKNILDKYYTLDSLNINSSFKSLESLIKENTINNSNLDNIVKNFYEDANTLFMINEKNKDNVSFFKNNFDIRKKIIFEYENKYIDFINNKNIFVKNKDEIFFSDFFKKFLIMIFNFSVKNKSMLLKTNDIENIKMEISEVISIFQI